MFDAEAELFRSMLSHAVLKDWTASSARFGSEAKIGCTFSRAASRMRLVSSSSTKWMSAGDTIRSCAISSTLYSVPSDARQRGLFRSSVVTIQRNAKPSQNFCPSDNTLNGREAKLEMALRQRVGGGVRSCMRLLTNGTRTSASALHSVPTYSCPAEVADKEVRGPSLTSNVPMRAASCSTSGLSVSRALAEIATHCALLSRPICRDSVSISPGETRSALLRTIICGIDW